MENVCETDKRASYKVNMEDGFTMGAPWGSSSCVITRAARRLHSEWNSCRRAAAWMKREYRNISEGGVYAPETPNWTWTRRKIKEGRRCREDGKAGQRDERTQKETPERLIIFHMIDFIWGSRWRWPGRADRGKRAEGGIRLTVKLQLKLGPEQKSENGGDIRVSSIIEEKSNNETTALMEITCSARPLHSELFGFVLPWSDASRCAYWIIKGHPNFKGAMIWREKSNHDTFLRYTTIIMIIYI